MQITLLHLIYKSIDGKKVTTPTKGIYVVRRLLTDGTVVTGKIVF